MKGKLRLIQVKEFQGIPAVLLQLGGTDDAGVERDIVFEYELHFNFEFERDVNARFAALKLGNG